MRWVRSWPAKVPEGRSYVVDSLPRYLMADYDYSILAGIDEDICLLEWDVALEREQQERFTHYALLAPERVLVAPYRLYHVATQPVWAHRSVDARGIAEWVREREPVCDYFAFGCIYLPRAHVRRYVECAGGAKMTDHTFAWWYRRHAGGITPICWDIRPVHLHC